MLRLEIRCRSRDMAFASANRPVTSDDLLRPLPHESTGHCKPIARGRPHDYRAGQRQRGDR